MLLGPSVKQSSGIPPHHCLSSAALPGRQFQYSVETSDASNTSQEDSYSRGLLTTVSITALFHLNSAHLFTSNIKLRNPEHSKMLFCLNQASYALWSICPKLRVGLSEPNLGHSWWLSTFPSIYIYIPFFSSFSFFLVTLCGLRNCSSPIRDGAQGPHSESTSPEPWTLMEFPAFFFLVFIPLSMFLYLFTALFSLVSPSLQHKSLTCSDTPWHISVCRPFGTTKNSCNAGPWGWGGEKTPHANPAPNYKYPFPQREGYTWNLHRLVPEFKSKKMSFKVLNYFVSFSDQTIVRESASNSCVEKHFFTPLSNLLQEPT